MKHQVMGYILGIVMLSVVAAVVWAADEKNAAMPQPPVLEDILERIESRYDRSNGFSAVFHQTSTIKAMDITDTAEGTIYIKRPGKMRWNYESPEPQQVVTDGVQLWIYRPEDRQVMVGAAPDFFGSGKGAGFLSDIKTIREEFAITLVTSDAPETDVLRLVPENPIADVAAVVLHVDKATGLIKTVVTLNAFEDETRIDLSDVVFSDDLSDDWFRFEVPAGVEVMSLEK